MIHQRNALAHQKGKTRIQAVNVPQKFETEIVRGDAIHAQFGLPQTDTGPEMIVRAYMEKPVYGIIGTNVEEICSRRDAHAELTRRDAAVEMARARLARGPEASRDPLVLIPQEESVRKKRGAPGGV